MRAALLALALAACGGFGDEGSNVDGGTGLCSARIAVAPADPTAPTTLSASATLNGGFGFVTIQWTITGPGGEVDPTPLDGTGLRVSFPAPAAGPYRVDAVITSGFQACPTTGVSVNVRAAGARMLDVRLRYAPLPGQGAPAQVDPQLVHLLGGADLTLPAPRVLDGGAAISGRLSGPSGGLAAYLRLDGPAAYELYADATGAFSGRLPAGSYQVLVVPYGAGAPPALFSARTAQELTAGLTLTAGEVVAGVVLDAGGEPVAGARVAVGSGALPAMVAITDAGGGFTARAQPGAIALAVVPPAPGARVAATLARAGAVEVRLPAVAVADVAATVVNAAGAPAPGARVTFSAASLSPAGTVSLDGAAPADAPASVRTTVTAGAGGVLPPLRLPRAVYDVVVEPPAGSGDVPAPVTVDLDDPPGELRSARPHSLRVTARDPTGAGVSGARVAAVARGLRGAGAGATASGTTGAAGTVFLPLAAGMTYDVTVEAPAARRLARARASATGGAADLVVALPAAIKLSGTLVFPSGAGQAGVRVEVLCVSCPSGALPLAEAVTDATGAFKLSLPDPGVDR